MHILNYWLYVSIPFFQNTYNCRFVAWIYMNKTWYTKFITKISHYNKFVEKFKSLYENNVWQSLISNISNQLFVSTISGNFNALILFDHLILNTNINHTNLERKTNDISHNFVFLDIFWLWFKWSEHIFLTRVQI